MKKFPALTRRILIFVVLCLPPMLLASQVETYPLPSVYPASQTFALKVNGIAVPVTEFVIKGSVHYHYAHFSFSGPIHLSVEASESIQSCEIRPGAFDLSATINGAAAEFSISQPRYLVLYINDFAKLIILADPLETDPPNIGDVNVTNILDYDVDSTGSTIETATVQRALDDVADAGGVLYFPAGLYTITRVFVKSNTTVYLQGGAVIRGTGKKTDYDEYEPGRYERATHLFTVDGATSVRFLGRGTIDGYGVTLADNVSDIRDANLKIRSISTHHSSDVIIDGIIARELTSWSVPFYYSDFVRASHVKVLNYAGLKHSDGINMCASQHGVVENCFVFTGDDAFCAKDYGGEPTHDIVFKNCVGYSSTRGVTLGMQAYDHMYDILYDGIYMVGVRDGIDFKHNDGYGDWENIWVKNVFVDECWGTPFNMHILEGGSINNVTIENYHCFSSGNASTIKGLNAQNKVSNIAFTDLYINEQLVLKRADGRFSVNRYAENIVFAQVGHETTHPLGRMEAEKMIGENVTIQANADASGEQLVLCQADSGTVSYFFTAASGAFDLTVASRHEAQGASRFTLKIENKTVTTWQVGGETNAPAGEVFTTHLIQNVAIATGQKITIVGFKEKSLMCGIDYVDVTRFEGYYPKELAVEAESGELGSAWITSNDDAASQGYAIRSECETCFSNPPSDSADIATYELFVSEGAYFLWFRIKHPDGENTDSFWLRMNGGDWKKWDHIAPNMPNDQYHWDVYDKKLTMNEGENILEVAGCEAGALLDKIFVSQSEGAPEDSTKLDLYLEAESAQVGSDWSILDDSRASGGQYIVSRTAASKENPPSDPDMITAFDFNAVAGDYKVWLRMRHPDGGNDDSFWLRMNDDPWIEWNQIADDKSDSEFHWDVNNAEFKLVPGSNILEIGIRENGSELDMVFISNSGAAPEDEPTLVSENPENKSSALKLCQNYPNPFNPSTVIEFVLPESEFVSLKIYNQLGQQVAELVSGELAAGTHRTTWDASGVSAGLYFYRFSTRQGFTDVKKLLYLK